MPECRAARRSRKGVRECFLRGNTQGKDGIFHGAKVLFFFLLRKKNLLFHRKEAKDVLPGLDRFCAVSAKRS
jgi:hypothetical protein